MVTIERVPTTITLLKGQGNLLQDVESNTLAAIAGTGAGKTVLGYWWLAARMMRYPGNTWLVVEPTFPLLEKVLVNSSDPGRPSLEQFFKEAGFRPDYRSVTKIMTTDYGQLYLGSADKPESMQGAAVKGAWLDEPGLMALLAYETAYQRVSMMRGQILLTTTPYNLGWLKTEIFDKNGTNGIHVERWRSIDRPGFPRDSYEDAKRRLPPWRFAMLYDALFERPAGVIYGAFNENTCLIDRFEIPHSWFIYAGHDFGRSNPAVLFYAQDPATGYFYAYKELLPGAGKSVHEIVEECKKITIGYNVIKRVGGNHAEEETRQAYTQQGWHIQEPALHKVEDQIDKVIGLHQLNKIFAFRDMKNYLDQKRSFSRELDDNGQVTEKIENEARFHLMAAERYLLSNFRPETIVHVEDLVAVNY